MDKKDIPNLPPIYIDGVKKLIAQFHDAYQRAKELSESLVGKSNHCTIMVDFSEKHPDNKIKGYFVFNRTILRFLPIIFDIALLFPMKDHRSNKVLKGILYKEIIEKKRNGKPVIIHFRNTSIKEFLPIISIRDLEVLVKSNSFKLDDLGNPVYEFPDIDCISIIDIPNNFLKRNYTLVGKQYYAPYSIDNEVYCVLFAEIDNIYDSHAIKVLRWLPAKKGVEIDQLIGLAPDGGDVFFEMGYISRQENSELHTFMSENDSRILFGKIKDSQITLLGGVKIFLSNEFKYPKCLYNIRLK